MCPEYGPGNPDEAVYCLKCDSSLTVYTLGEDKVMSTITKNLNKEKCQRYRAPAIILTLISVGMMLL